MISNKPTYTYFENDDIQPVLQAATNTLLLNASLVDNPGLMHGKMGISICFFHLSLALTRLLKIIKADHITPGHSYSQSLKQFNIGPIIDNLLEKINRNTIESELPPDDTTMRHGISGIAWIYMELHRLEDGSHFNDEMEYWIGKLFSSKDKESLLTRHFNEGDNIFGILEGLAGMMLLTKSFKKEALKQ